VKHAIAHVIIWGGMGLLFATNEWSPVSYVFVCLLISFYAWVVITASDWGLGKTSRNMPPAQPWQSRYYGDTPAGQRRQQEQRQQEYTSYNSSTGYTSYTPTRPPDFDPEAREITPTDEQDKMLLAAAQGAIMQGATLPSGKIVPNCKEGENWIAKGDRIIRVTDQEFFQTNPEHADEALG